MQSIAPVISTQEKLTTLKGEPCMVVVDPLTRKLLIPCDAILPTRAQQRPTIPSLCQLFLQNRCRQGANCHQVHAPLDTVRPLREEVTSLPLCCTEHGDVDHAGVADPHSGLSNAFLHLPESTYNKGYIPLCLVSYTIPVSKLLNELPSDTRAAVERHRQAAASGEIMEDTPPLVCLEAGNIPICRLHATSRCHYAEECSFLHLCKKVTEQDPQLPLGRRSRMMKNMQKSPLLTNESAPHMQPRILQQQQQREQLHQQGVSNNGNNGNNNNNIIIMNSNNNNNTNTNSLGTVPHSLSAMRRPISNFSPPTPHVRQPWVRGYALTRSPCASLGNSLGNSFGNSFGNSLGNSLGNSIGNSIGNYSVLASAMHSMPREQQQHFVQQIHIQQQQQQIQSQSQSQNNSPIIQPVVQDELSGSLRKKCKEQRSPQLPRFCGSIRTAVDDSSSVWPLLPHSASIVNNSINANNSNNAINVISGIPSISTTVPFSSEINKDVPVHSSPISVHTSLSDSLGTGSRDEGLSTSPLNLSSSRCGGRSWRHNPYGFKVLRGTRVE